MVATVPLTLPPPPELVIVQAPLAPTHPSRIWTDPVGPELNPPTARSDWAAVSDVDRTHLRR